MKSVLQEEKGNCVTSASCTMTGEYSVNAAMFPTVPKSAPLPHTSMLTIYMATPKLVFWCHYISPVCNMQHFFRTNFRFSFPHAIKKARTNHHRVANSLRNSPRLNGSLKPLCSCSFFNLHIFLLALYRQAFYRNPIILIFCKHHTCLTVSL